MSRLATLLFLLNLLVAPACDRGEAQIERLIEHTEAIVALLEQHAADPTAALAAVEAYEKEHGAELDALEADARKIREDVGTKGKRDLRELWQRKAAALHERVEALRGTKAP